PPYPLEGFSPRLWERGFFTLPFWDVLAALTPFAVIPPPVQLLGRIAKLDHEITRQVLGLHFAPLLPPEPEQGAFVVAHDDPGIRTADKIATDFPKRSHRRLSLKAKVDFMLFTSTPIRIGSRLEQQTNARSHNDSFLI